MKTCAKPDSRSYTGLLASCFVSSTSNQHQQVISREFRDWVTTLPSDGADGQLSRRDFTSKCHTTESSNPARRCTYLTFDSSTTATQQLPALPGLVRFLTWANSWKQSLGEASKVLRQSSQVAKEPFITIPPSISVNMSGITVVVAAL